MIEHVFDHMLENRSFDHTLGWSGIRGTDPVSGEHAPSRLADCEDSLTHRLADEQEYQAQRGGIT